MCGGERGGLTSLFKMGVRFILCIFRSRFTCLLFCFYFITFSLLSISASVRQKQLYTPKGDAPPGVEGTHIVEMAMAIAGAMLKPAKFEVRIAVVMVVLYSLF